MKDVIKSKKTKKIRKNIRGKLTKKRNMNSPLTTTKCKIVGMDEDEIIDLSEIVYDEKDGLYIKDKTQGVKIIFPIKKELPLEESLLKIAEGTYGTIYLIHTKHNHKQYNLVLKIANRPGGEIEEEYALGLLKDYNVDCGVINVRIMTIKEIPNISVMNRMNGDFSKLTGDIELRTLPKLLYATAYCFQCLVSNELGYLDIKPMNLLYKCLENEEYIVKLGDIGSIGVLGTEQVSTYIPYEQRFTPRISMNITVESMVYLLAATLLSLFDPDDNILNTFYIRNDNYNTGSIKREINDFLFEKQFYKIQYGKSNKTLDLLFHRMLDLNHKNRPTFKEIMQELKED